MARCAPLLLRVLSGRRDGLVCRGNFTMVLVTSLAIVLMAVQTRNVSGSHVKQVAKRSVNDCQDYSLVADRCPAWKELGFCVNHEREMQFVCNKTCEYCVPDKWAAKLRVWAQLQKPNKAVDEPRDEELAGSKIKKPSVQVISKEDLDAAASAIVNELQFHGKEQSTPKSRQIPDQWTAKRIWGRLQVPDNAMDGPRLAAEAENKTTKPSVQVMGKEDVDAEATAAIVDELQFHAKEQSRPKSNSTMSLTAEIMGRVQSDNESTADGVENQQRKPSQNETQPNELSMVDKMSSRLINRLSSGNDNEAKSKPIDMQHDLAKLLQIAATSSKGPRENDKDSTSAAPATPPSRSRFELNTESMKTPLYLFENTEGRGSKDEKKKIKEASISIRNVLKLINQGKKTNLHTGLKTGIPTRVGPVEQLLHEFEASRKPSDRAMDRIKNRQHSGLGNGLTTDDSGTWKKLAHRLALQLQRVLRHTRLREFAQEHQKAALREQMIDMIRHEDDDEDDDDDDDDDEAANVSRLLDFQRSHRKNVTRETLGTRHAAENDREETNK